MADQALSSLYVLLGLDTVNFEKGAEDAKKIAKETASDIDDSFGSLTEGRGGLMLTEEALGVRLPRHLNTLLAKIPGVSEAFSAMLPIAGVAVAIGIVGKLIEKHDEALQKAREQKEAWAAFTDKINDQSDALELENDKLRNTIAIYGGKSPNLVKIALDEAVVAADKLYGGLKKDIEELEKMEQATHVGIFKQMMGEAGDASEELQPFIDAILATEDASKKAIAAAKASGDAKKVEAAQTKADADVQAAYGNAIAKTTDIWNKSNELMVKGIGTFTHNAQGQIIVIQDQTQRMTMLGQVHEKLTAQMHEASLGADHMSLSLTAALQDPAKSAKKLQESAEALAHSLKELGDAEDKEAASKALLALSGVKQTADSEAQITAIKVAATQKQYANDMQAAMQHLNIVANTAGATKSQIEVAQNTILALAANFQTKMNDEEAAGNNKREHEEEEAARQRIELSRKMGEETLKYEDAISQLRYSQSIKADALAMKMGQVSLAQDLANRRAAEQTRYNDMKAAIGKERALIDAADPQIEAKQKEMDDKLLLLRKQFEDKDLDLIKEAEAAKALAVRAAEDKVADAIAKTAAKSIVESKNMGAAFHALGKQMAEEALTSLLELETVEGRKKLVKAKSAASGAYAGVMDMDLPPVIAFPLAIASGAAAFAGVMAFEQGGIVPSTQMAMVHQNEMVLPAGLSKGLQSMVGRGNGGRSSTVNMHINTPNADSFRASRHQIDSEMHHSISRAAGRN